MAEAVTVERTGPRGKPCSLPSALPPRPHRRRPPLATVVLVDTLDPAVGAPEMVDFGPFDTVRRSFRARNMYPHEATVTITRTTEAEAALDSSAGGRAPNGEHELARHRQSADGGGVTWAGTGRRRRERAAAAVRSASP